MSKSQQTDREKLERAAVRVLKASREDADLSRQEMAERLGLTYAQIVNIEHGRRAVHLADFILFAKALGIDPVRLFERVARW